MGNPDEKGHARRQPLPERQPGGMSSCFKNGSKYMGSPVRPLEKQLESVALEKARLERRLGNTWLEPRSPSSENGLPMEHQMELLSIEKDKLERRLKDQNK